ncbi:hypothetical protein [Halonotius terrestris]|uniref:hypothetical protein n=1 Tax=Halonotius terrestris TaxID=2487750 RepID=UPI00163CDF67|nr:hypothetical protein [Halonotius terrestris]
MVERNRRRMLIGIGALAVGASGFVASGAFSLGSDGSLGDDWVQVEGTNQAVSFNPTQSQTGDGSTGGGGGGGDGGDDSTDGDTTDEETDSEEEQPTEEEEQPPEEEQTEEEQPTEEEEQPPEEEQTEEEQTDDSDTETETLTTRVQVVTDPNNSSNAVNGSGSARWNGTVFDTDLVLGTSEGFFRGVAAENVNANAVSTIGDTDTNGYPNGRVAFIIANVGPEGGGPGATVRVSGQLFADGEAISTDQLRFPYRVVDNDGNAVSRGGNLLSGSGVRLQNSHVIEVVIVIDTRGGVDDLERIDNLRFTAEGVN